jgi:hypothetical protein
MTTIAEQQRGRPAMRQPPSRCHNALAAACFLSGLSGSYCVCAGK